MRTVDQVLFLLSLLDLLRSALKSLFLILVENSGVMTIH